MKMHELEGVLRQHISKFLNVPKMHGEEVTVKTPTPKGKRNRTLLPEH